MDRDDLFELSLKDWGRPITTVSYPGKSAIVAVEKSVSVPRSESLADCAERVLPLWNNEIAPRVARGETVLIVAHANSIRSLVKYIDRGKPLTPTVSWIRSPLSSTDTMTVSSFRDVHIPSATPLVYIFTATTDSKQRYTLQSLGDPTSLGMTGRFIATKEIFRLSLTSSSFTATAPSPSPSPSTLPSPPPSSSSSSSCLDDHHHSNASLHDLVTDIIEHSSESASGESDGLIILDGRGVIVHSNLTWQTLYGLAPRDSSQRLSLVNADDRQREKENEKKEKKRINIMPVQNWLVDRESILT